MKNCYCHENQQIYKSISACLNDLGIPNTQQYKIYGILRHNNMAEIQGYHIGYSKEEVEKEIDMWRQPFEGCDLEVNRAGQVRKKSTKSLKTLTYDGFGYLYTTIKTKDFSKVYRVHRLIAKAFLPEYEEHLVVDHINGIRDDNRVENLCVKTQQENIAARDKNNAPLYQELRRLIIQYGYEETLSKLKEL